MSFSGNDRPVVITGAGGQVGSAFAKLLPSALLLDRSDLDLARPDTVVEAIEHLNPSGIINCAAYTNVDGAEQEEDVATDVNGHSVGELASVTAQMKIPFMTFSTDYVFNGESERPYVESDDVDPINAYGRSKLVGEQLAMRRNPNSLIVRTSWVVSATHDNFVATMLRLATGPDSRVRVVDDQHGCLTIAADLARASLSLMELGTSGLVHCANGPAGTWYDIACAVVEYAGLPGRITPCSTAEFPRPAARPSNSVLDSERLADTGVKPLPVWTTSLPAVVDAQMKRLSLVE